MTKPKNPTPEQLQAYRERRAREKRDARARKAQPQPEQPKTLAQLKCERDEARRRVHEVDRECQRLARWEAANNDGPGTFRDKFRTAWERLKPLLVEARAERDAAIKAYADAVKRERERRRNARG